MGKQHGGADVDKPESGCVYSLCVDERENLRDQLREAHAREAALVEELLAIMGKKIGPPFNTTEAFRVDQLLGINISAEAKELLKAKGKLEAAGAHLMVQSGAQFQDARASYEVIYRILYPQEAK